MNSSSADIARTLAGADRKRGKMLWLVLGLVLAVAFGGWLWLRQSGADATIAYITEPVSRGDLTVTVTATGTVQPTTQVEVSSELSGTLASVEADFNDEVAVGQVLARLDDTKLVAQLANAEASLAAAKGRVAQAEATAREALALYESQKELDRRGLTSATGFVPYVAAHERADAEVEIARADLTLAEANLKLQQADLDKAQIRSPIKGVVLDRDADAGQIVASSLSAPTLFVLAEDLSKMELQVDIDEADIGRVTVGNDAHFTVDAYSGRSFPARITQVRYAPETTDGVVTYKAVLSVENSEKLLRPGMTATATIVVAKVADALQVPNAALRFTPPQVADSSGGGSGAGLIGLIMPSPPREGGGSVAGTADTLWVLRGGVAEEIVVIPGETDGKRTAITAEGLVVGDLVITDQGEAR